VQKLIDDRDVDLLGGHLSNRKIDLVVTGGIAAVECVKLIRELRRYGADVRVSMTPSATTFVSPKSLEWAAKNPVLTDLSGAAEHITHADAVIIAPCSLDFMSKIALGLADSAAATLVQSAISRIPVFFAPSMHLSLQGNPAYARNLEALRAISHVTIFETQVNEGKAKMMAFEEMVARVSHALNAAGKLGGKSVAITLGATRSPVDDVRHLGNSSSGALGFAIADELYRAGANVHAICGDTSVAAPHSPIEIQKVSTNSEMLAALQLVCQRSRPSIGIFSAAVLDFEVANPRNGKTSSKDSLSIQLQPAPKVHAALDYRFETKVGFKLESQLSVEELKKKITHWALEAQCQFVVGNRLEDVHRKDGTSTEHEAHIWARSANAFETIKGKPAIARRLRELLESHL